MRGQPGHPRGGVRRDRPAPGPGAGRRARAAGRTPAPASARAPAPGRAARWRSVPRPAPPRRRCRRGCRRRTPANRPAGRRRGRRAAATRSVCSGDVRRSPRSRSSASMPSRVAAYAEGTPSSPSSQASGSGPAPGCRDVTARTLSGSVEGVRGGPGTDRPRDGRAGPWSARASASAASPTATTGPAPATRRDAVRWLVGDRQARVVELGAGTGKLTGALVALDHLVLATDPDERMLHRLRLRRPDALRGGRAGRADPGCRTARPTWWWRRRRFHWFDLSLAVPEMARVLRPRRRCWPWSGTSATRAVPWVKKLGRLIGTQDQRMRPGRRLDGVRRVRRGRDPDLPALADPRPPRPARPRRLALQPGQHGRGRARRAPRADRGAVRRLRPRDRTACSCPT